MDELRQIARCVEGDAQRHGRPGELPRIRHCRERLLEPRPPALPPVRPPVTHRVAGSGGVNQAKASAPPETAAGREASPAGPA